MHQIQEHYQTIAALTQKEAVTTPPVPLGVDGTFLEWLFSPWLIYASVILFIILFLGGLVWQIRERVLDSKRSMATFIVALLIALIPYSLRTALQMTSVQTRAGPDEAPREINLLQTTANAYLITWETTAYKVGAVRFGPAPLLETTSQIVIAGDGKKNIRHAAKLEKLNKGIMYELEILSGKEWYNDNGKPIQFKLNSP